jgi:pimeloyl-ACP methyl ester carboxylesterase
MPILLCAVLLLILPPLVQAAEPFHDRAHSSKVFGQERHYRIFLPPGYESGEVRYPVIYYFHGHSDRYTLEHYDQGQDTVPKIIDFARSHDTIVVSVDGYVAEDYTGFYGGSPWDVREEGGNYDFGEYFRELVAHIDGAYRTLTDRRHRATSGLSMGGFMSLYLSARYPGLIGSASSFNPGPEFFTGDKGRRVLWRPKDHVANHTQTMIRLIRASGDYISQYHEETRDAYARALDVDFEYRRDEYHRHWATSIGETFAFHMRAFERSELDNVPVVFHHANAYRSFDVWDYHVESEGAEPGITYLDQVRQGSLRVTTRQWAPDGPPAADRAIHVTTAPLYQAGANYRLTDYNLQSAKTLESQVTADPHGRIRFRVDGDGHQISFVGAGTGAQPPELLPMTGKDKLRVAPNVEVALPVRVHNPRGEAMKEVRVEVSSEYPTVKVLGGSAAIPEIAPGQAVDLADRLKARFTAGIGYFAPARLDVRIVYDGWQESSDVVDLLVTPESIPQPAAVEILDGRTVKFQVFHQAGNQGGGKSIEREVTEGTGNGNGVLEPGEQATIWVKIVQGLDPFDKNNWYRCKVYSDSPYVVEAGDIREGKQREWTGAQYRTSLIRLARETPPGTRIELLLDNESWSFHFTPDARYGREKLYQAFQLHRNHLHRYELGAIK